MARNRLRTAHAFSSLSVQTLPSERPRARAEYYSQAKRLFANYDGIEVLKKDIMRVLTDRSSPIQVHEHWKTLSSEQQQLIAPDLLDAWIRYHADLLTAYDPKDPDESKLLELIDSANQAHNVIDRLYPKWSPRRFGGSPEDAKETEDSAAVARAHQILALWASTSEAGHARNCKQLRGIPQRTQFLWQQLPISTAASNALLRTWAYSHEHWRGTRAQSIFDELTSPNAETYRLMIRAWAWSGERRAAFTATGFLRKMLRLLDQGNTDMEPSLEEYRIVLKAWTSAKYVCFVWFQLHFYTF